MSFFRVSQAQTCWLNVFNHYTLAFELYFALKQRSISNTGCSFWWIPIVFLWFWSPNLPLRSPQPYHYNTAAETKQSWNQTRVGATGTACTEPELKWPTLTSKTGFSTSAITVIYQLCQATIGSSSFKQTSSIFQPKWKQKWINVCSLHISSNCKEKLLRSLHTICSTRNLINFCRLS